MGFGEDVDLNVDVDVSPVHVHVRIHVGEHCLSLLLRVARAGSFSCSVAACLSHVAIVVVVGVCSHADFIGSVILLKKRKSYFQSLF